MTTPGGHQDLVCRAYAVLGTLGLPEEQHDQLRFLVHALALLHLGSADSGQRFQRILALAGEPTSQDLSNAERLLPHLRGALGDAGMPSTAEVASLLRKEQLNSYGVMAPHGKGGERRLRGSAIYAQASLINHECAPNVARFDHFDSDRPDSTFVHFRALHDLPAGTELAQSYCPLSWNFQMRQQQCRDVYGFTCSCPRCQTESQANDACAGTDAASSGSWATDDGDDAGSGDGEEGMDEDGQDTDMLLYICPQRKCFGTMAPVALGDTEHECNVCGKRRSEREFMAHLDKH